MWGCKTDENCVPHHDLPLEVAKMAEKECPDSPTCKYVAYCKCAPLVQPASTPDWDGNLAAPVVQPASSMIESSSDADAEMSPTKVLTALLGAGALGGTTSTANASQAPTSMDGVVVARGIPGPGIARTGPATMHDGPNIHNVGLRKAMHRESAQRSRDEKRQRL